LTVPRKFFRGKSVFRGISSDVFRENPRTVFHT
jgi:hypothetical protein